MDGGIFYNQIIIFEVLWCTVKYSKIGFSGNRLPKSILKIKEGFSINLIINFPLGQCQSEDYDSWYDENEIKERDKNAGLF